VLRLFSGEVIRFLRFHKGWGQEELARRSGLSQATISYIENGTHRLTPRTRQKLMDTFEIDEADLIAVFNHVQMMKQFEI